MKRPKNNPLSRGDYLKSLLFNNTGYMILPGTGVE
jgi:hypothetical protein